MAKRVVCNPRSRAMCFRPNLVTPFERERERARRHYALYLGQNSVYGRGLMASFGIAFFVRHPPLGYLMRDAMCVRGVCVHLTSPAAILLFKNIIK